MSSKTPSLDRSSWLEQRRLINSKYMVKNITGPVLIDDNTRSELINESVSTPGDKLRRFFRKQNNSQKSISSIHDSALDLKSVASYREKGFAYQKHHKHSYIDMEILKSTASKYEGLIAEPLIYYPKKRSNTAADLSKFIGLAENQRETAGTNKRLLSTKKDSDENVENPPRFQNRSPLSQGKIENPSLQASGLLRKTKSPAFSHSLGFFTRPSTMGAQGIGALPSQALVQSPKTFANQSREQAKKKELELNLDFTSKQLLLYNMRSIVERAGNYPLKSAKFDGFENKDFQNYLKRSFAEAGQKPRDQEAERGSGPKSAKKLFLDGAASNKVELVKPSESLVAGKAPQRSTLTASPKPDSSKAQFKQDECISPSVKLRKSHMRNSRISVLAMPKFLTRKSTIVTPIQQLDVGHLLNEVSSGSNAASILKMIKSHKHFTQSALKHDYEGPAAQELRNIRGENTETLNFLKRKLDVYLSESLLKDDAGLAKATSRVLSFEELDYVREKCYFRKLSKNYINHVENILSKLSFFRKFSQGVRLSILETCEWVSFPANHVVFKQGDAGELIYIIIKGSVNIFLEKKHSLLGVERFIVNSLYDGDHFGDLAMIGAHLENPALFFRKPLLEVEPEEEIKAAQKIRRASVSLSKKIEEDNDEELEENDQDGSVQGKKFGFKNTLASAKMPKKGNADAITENFRPRRPATVETTEDSFMITIQREKYQDILLNILQIELEKKLSVLVEVDFLQDEQTYSLLPLASNLKTRHYKLGEAIVKIGDPLKYFYIISHGKCEVIHPKLVKIDLLAKRKKKMSQGFSYKDVIEESSKKNAAFEEEEEETIVPSKKNLTKDEREFLDLTKTREFPKSDKKVSNGILTYTEHVVLGHLDKGSYFCGRALFSAKEYQEKEKLYPKFDWKKMREKCLMTVLADDPVVEIYYIDLDGLEGIPKELREKIIAPLIKKQEFDQYDIEKEIDFKDTWLHFKRNVIEESLKEKKMSRDKNLFRGGHLPD